MAAQTVIKTPEGHTLKFLSESYVVGTYTATYFNGDGPNQGSSILKEDKYHEKIRKQAVKNGHTIVEEESTPMSSIKEHTKEFWLKNKDHDTSKK